MSAALIAALLFTVALLVTTAYFLLGSVPLVILKHDTPLDARFVRGFFNIYYMAAIFTASAAAVSHAFAGRPVFAAVAAALALFATIQRWKVIPRMDSLKVQIQVVGTDAIPGFRRAHLLGIMANVAQLVIIVWSLTTFSLH